MLRYAILLLIVMAAGVGLFFLRSDSPTTPFESVKAAMVAKEPHRIWYALPASYQKDIEQLLSTLETRIPAESYDRASRLLRTLGQILVEKRDFLVENSLARRFMLLPDGKDAARESLDAAGNTITTLADSELGRHADLAKLDYEKLFTGTLSRATSHLERWFENSSATKFDWRDVQWELVEEKGDRATVRVRVGDDEPEDWEMVRVEGKWIPRSLADSWDATIRKARRGLQAWNPSDQTWLQNTIARWEHGLEPLMVAKNQEDFDRALNAIPILLLSF